MVERGMAASASVISLMIILNSAPDCNACPAQVANEAEMRRALHVGAKVKAYG